MTRTKSYHRILSLALCFSLVTATAAWARFRPTPTAPRGRVPPMGTRGCSAETTLDFTALAPVSTVSDLTLNQTTIAWYAPDRESYPIKLKLYQDVTPQAATPTWEVLKEFSLQSTQGVMSFQLPADLLKEGQVYTWQAVLSCVPGYPSADLVTETQFKVVPLAATLQPQLSQAQDARARSQVYATAGLWYGAFAEVLSSKSDRVRLLKELMEYQQAQPVSDPRLAKRILQHNEAIAKIVEVLNQQ
jgi:Domain of Unknown Function (DUF928)